MAGAGSPTIISPASTNLEVHRMQMDTGTMNRQSALMMKLTDESIAAIRAAQKARQPVRLKIDKQGGAIEIGTGEQVTKFRFVVQEVPGAPADAVSFDCQKKYRTVATFHSKIQVQTTAKALAETREKLIEEEKKKKMKESSRHKREQRPVTVKRATNPLAIGAQRPSPSSSARSHHTDSSSKTAASKSTGNQQHVFSNSSAGMSTFQIPVKYLSGATLISQTNASHSLMDEIIAQLRKDSLNEEIAQEDAERVQEIVDEVGEMNRDTGRLQLKQAFYNEVDARWPGFCADEKGYVRKILSGNMGNITNFAPVRKSRIGPMVAPTSGVVHGSGPPSTDDSSTHVVQSKSPESTASSISSKSPAEVISNVNSVETNGKVMDDLSNTNVLNSKRKAHAQSAPAAPPTASKRPRQQSLSPPEDPSNANLAMHPQQTKNNSQRVVGINDAERLSEPMSSGSNNVSLNSAPQPSRDWTKEFPEPRSLEEAEKYYVKFLEDYPKYLTYYNRLSAVVSEFRELEKKMNEAPKNTREHEKAEEAIETRYMHYQRNAEYLETRQKHEDLRSKLEVLKKHVDTWENNHKKHVSSDKNSLNSSNNNSNSNNHIMKNAASVV